jgi:integrase
MTDHRLFDSALRTACDNTVLVDHTGAKLVTSHRFRHTVGTQLAEQGARLQTIMSILGHSSSTMSLIYARIADTTVLQDYKDALQSPPPNTPPPERSTLSGTHPRRGRRQPRMAPRS